MSCALGPSPRAWGSRRNPTPLRRVRRSIPTCVGLTATSVVHSATNQVHPHVRGAHLPAAAGVGDVDGPSPRAWGSHRGTDEHPTVRRSIPTCVGLTQHTPHGQQEDQVHPHVRGAHLPAPEESAAMTGPSPRAWGSRGEVLWPWGARRSIPTCVGLTKAACPYRPAPPVHPHVRGAHHPGRGQIRGYGGPSPRAWGSPSACGPLSLPSRSIPTCVGLTLTATARADAAPVHPHVRGAHVALQHGMPAILGPSPRAWGSRSSRNSPTRGCRSIPTCVGLTRCGRSTGPGRTVHPHVRGAHIIKAACYDQTNGPSPRAWGSRPPGQDARPRRRSIPTCVGLTQPRPHTATGEPVHPHVRGAHQAQFHYARCVDGPSPRAWGSRWGPRRPARPGRSIPTCVGLTTAGESSMIMGAVHPHVRGAHVSRRFRSPIHGGPSPRAWGSRARRALTVRARRSIPTCVGLTGPYFRRYSTHAVHPHVRGAHPYTSVVRVTSIGPSPRAWGSLGGSLHGGLHDRSIPTCVGLTRSGTTRVGWRTVHPHVRGAHTAGQRATR